MMDKLLNMTGRVLLAQIFILSGFSKISAYAGTQAYMEAMGVPGILLAGVIALEIVAGLAMLLGWKTRWAALALAAFSVVAALVFHANFADQMQTILFMKNIALAGGLMVLAAQHNQHSYSLDHRLHTAG